VPAAAAAATATRRRSRARRVFSDGPTTARTRADGR